MANNLLIKLKKINKDFYTLSDLEKISGLSRPSLLVALSRLEKSGRIKRVSRGNYQSADSPLNIEVIACQIYQQAYISFESALSKYGILSQVPYTLTMATINKPKKIKIGDREIEYRRLKPELFFGYKLINNCYLAEAEKALLDTIYLQSKGLIAVDFNELNFKNIRKTYLKQYLKSYPVPTKKLAIKLIPQLKNGG